MPEHALDRWEREFRAAAEADHFADFRDHLERLELPDAPELMLQGTIALVRMCSAYAAMDRQQERFTAFLDMQKYNPLEATTARYAFTFDVWGKAFARVLVETNFQSIDLADLYGMPWLDYQVRGFPHFWISHPDWSEFTSEEIRQLEDEVENDLYFDYDDSEVRYWFNYLPDPTYLQVTVQDAYRSEDEE